MRLWWDGRSGERLREKREKESVRFPTLSIPRLTSANPNPLIRTPSKLENLTHTRFLGTRCEVERTPGWVFLVAIPRVQTFNLHGRVLQQRQLKAGRSPFSHSVINLPIKGLADADLAGYKLDAPVGPLRRTLMMGLGARRKRNSNGCWNSPSETRVGGNNG